MSPETVMNIGRQAMEITVMTALPFLGVALVVGLTVSIFQAATQINETTLSFIPKFLGILATMLLAGPWILSVLVDYMHQMLTNFPLLTN